MRKNSSLSLVFFLFLTLILGLVFTWPLAQNFFSSIPYTLKPIAGFEQVPLMPGDHLQTYYWFWLFADNLFGASSLFTNPYEFNGPMGPMSSVYANFPFSLLYLIFLPLGPIGAYNSLILLSFLLSGLAMFLLARSWTQDPWAAIFAGLIFAVAPYRVSHIAGGQLFGYVIFLLPLCLYFVESALTQGRWFYGAAAGMCLILMSFMEPHASYLTALTLGIYLPGRIFLVRPLSLSSGEVCPPLWPGLTGALMGGVSFSCFLWMRWGKKAGLPFWHSDMVQPLVLGTLASLLVWFFLSALLVRLTTLSFADLRHRIGKYFLSLLPLGFYALKYWIDLPYLGLILPLLSFGLLSAGLFALWIKGRDRLRLFDASRILPVVFGVGTGLAIASAYLMHIKKTVFLPSIAGKGRVIQEVLLFSPKAGNLFSWQDINQERFVVLGWGLLLLAALGMIPLFKKKHPKNPGTLALAGMIAFLATVLTLGPTLTYFPIYRFLYDYLPFFNYPRVPGRFVIISFIFMGLLGGCALASFREWAANKGRLSLGKWLPFLIVLLIVAEYHPFQPLGLSRIKGENRIYQEIRNELSEKHRVLELPIWPGDSHQSSTYEYTVTRTQKPMINGYAPVVVRDYIQQIFWPLYPLDQGEFKETQAQVLDKLKVDLITFHENAQVYTEKVSPFPPRLALKRLMASPGLKLMRHDQDISLFRVGHDYVPSTNSATITSPVTAVFYVNNLPQEIGRFQKDPLASGYYLLMDEQALSRGELVPRPGVRGNVVSANPDQDRPGYLCLGTNRFFPAGKYRARFRIRAGVAGPLKEVGRLEIIEGRTKVIAQKTLRETELVHHDSWTDIPVEFEITQTREIGFRVYFSGEAPLEFNLLVIGFSDQNTGPGVIEAEDLLRQTGTVVSDPLASGQEAVLGKAGFHPPIYLCYGPYRTFEPGRYRANFSLRLNGPLQGSPKEAVALLEVATDMGKRIFGHLGVKVQDLSPDEYRPLELTFNVPFRCELGYRVKYKGRADLLVDRISINSTGVTR